MIRRLLAFMFRHDYAVDPKRVRILNGSPMTTIVCNRRVTSVCMGCGMVSAILDMSGKEQTQ